MQTLLHDLGIFNFLPGIGSKIYYFGYGFYSLVKYWNNFWIFYSENSSTGLI